jgi:hypothetical protein
MKVPFNFGKGKSSLKEYQHPIPAPEHPKQYRAIGLLYGRYQPDEAKSNRGILILDNNQILDAVLLGKVICIVKKHLDLEKKHLWVVYPRMQKNSDNFHVQITGVWEPETLKYDSQNQFISTQSLIPESRYFSIRGEVVFYNEEDERIIVKIIQSSSGKNAKSNFLKLELKGILDINPLGHFFDLEVELQDQILVITKAQDLGFLAVKYTPKPLQSNPKPVIINKTSR